jgi:hypothetical protein
MSKLVERLFASVEHLIRAERRDERFIPAGRSGKHEGALAVGELNGVSADVTGAA